MKGLCFLVLVFMLASCSNEDVVKINRKDPGIYAHYDIRAEEGGEMATCVVRFFKDRSMKNPLTLKGTEKIELDGQEMPVDSSRILGAYYELQRPVSDFEGPHTITFTSNHEEFKEELNFQSLLLLNQFDKPIPKDDLVLELEGLAPEEEVRMVMMDTAFHSDEINQLVTIKDGKLMIESGLLRTLKTGPVLLQLSKELERPLTSGMPGVLTITYSLKRDLVLMD
jgi:hypothetical protein